MGATDECTEFPLQAGMDEMRVGFDGEHILIAEPQKVSGELL